MIRARIFRLSAVLLLLLMGVDLIACDVLAPEQCESFGYPSGQQSQKVDDNCICCCAHIVLASFAPLVVTAGVAGVLAAEDPPKAEYQSSSIYHPPKA